MRIVILGANFAGLQALKKLRKIQKKHEIVVIDKHDHATMIPALPDRAAGIVSSLPLRESYNSLLPSGVSFVQATVESVDFSHRSISTCDGVVTYDVLLCCAGAAARPFPVDTGSIPVYSLMDLGDAEKIYESLSRYVNEKKGRDVLIVGGGYTGCELAGAIALSSFSPHLHITILTLDDSIIPFLTDSERALLEQELSQCGVTVLCNTSIASVTGETVVTQKGEKFTNPFICSAIGAVSSISHFSGLDEYSHGAPLPVTSTLQLANHPEVFVAGDMALLKNRDGTVVRKAVNFSKMSGATAGKNCLRFIENRPLLSFVPIDLGWVIPVGRTSVGRLFSKIPIRGKAGLFLHYFMSGVQNFSMKNFFAFVKISFREIFR
ncbi:NAD(P)/FAD-dependent oxidoreductase [Chitinivibrio alkaliphilus]|uniref:NADH dehydrogenase n=1 Tax=Chitinivibrio alkaliphilus ACht1 TaxID=1313304 RepID=U7D8Q0_9BACT|nr:FAD-dependent oxidoreductase [Chitinivibrio alkaliphilus]ERP31951.1 NADH dehydrogenase [Chitinivibrio alkaliphilus ACht1]